MIPPEWFSQARSRIQRYVSCTPVTLDEQLSAWIKWENQQRTGSFKIRGALNKILSLTEWECQKGLVAASAGNHGQGVAYAAQLRSSRSVIFVPDHAPSIKVDAMRLLGADIRIVHGGYEAAERDGKAYASSEGLVWISPYNDGQIVAGQGTLFLEVFEQLAWSELQSCVVPLGGGGLLAAGAALIKTLYPTVRVIGVQAAASPFFFHQYHFHTQEGAQDMPSLADGLTGAVEANSITIPIVQKLVDDILLVDESEIEEAIAYAWYKHQQRIEGSGAVALAAVMSGRINHHPAVGIISGGNINADEFDRIIQNCPDSIKYA